MLKKLILALILAATASGASHAFSVNLDPPSLWLNVKPGGSASGTIQLENRGDDVIEVKAYTEDWLYAKDRSKTFKPAGSLPYSCSNWITVYPSDFTLDPGRAVEVKYSVNVPSTASGGYYSVIFFESILEPEEGAKKSNVTFASRVGTIVYLDAAGTTNRSASIRNFTVQEPDNQRPMFATITIRNDGNALITPEGNIIITDSGANLYATMKLKNIYVLPGESVDVRREWRGVLREGEYDAIATLDFGGKEPVSAQSKLYISRMNKLSGVTLYPGSKPKISFVFTNLTLSKVDLQSKYEVKAEDGTVIANNNLKEVGVSANSSKKMTADLGTSLPKGKITVKVQIYANEEVISKTENFWIE